MGNSIVFSMKNKGVIKMEESIKIINGNTTFEYAQTNGIRTIGELLTHLRNNDCWLKVGDKVLKPNTSGKMYDIIKSYDQRWNIVKVKPIIKASYYTREVPLTNISRIFKDGDGTMEATMRAVFWNEMRKIVEAHTTSC